MTDVATLGEAMIAIRSRGRLAMGNPMSASLAGAESNVAIGLARLGHASSWAGVVGTDSAGDLALRTMLAEGVAATGVRRTTDAPTGVMLVDMPPALPPVVTYHRRGSAGATLAPADVLRLGKHRLWHLTGITPALSTSAGEAACAAIDEARRTDAIVSFDVNFRSKLWSRAAAAAKLAPLARRADIVIASEDELSLVADGADEAARVSSLLAAGVREVVVKRGGRGASHIDRSGETSHPAHPVIEVNSIGAGDAFTAGYLSGVLDGLAVIGRLERGALCGALAVTGIGDWEQAPTRGELAVLAAAHSDAIR